MRRAIGSFTLQSALTAVFCVLLAPVQAQAQSVQWAPDSVTILVQRGATSAVKVDLLLQGGITGITVVPDPRLQPYLAVQFNGVAAPATGHTPPPTGGTASVELIASVPFRSPTQRINGMVYVRSNRTGTPLGTPLPVVLQVVTESVGLVEGINFKARLHIPSGWYVINDADANASNVFSPNTAAAIDGGVAVARADLAISVADNDLNLPLADFAKTFRGGKFSKYATSQTRLISGVSSLVVSDELSQVPFEPLRAALVPRGSQVVVIAAYGKLAATEFEAFLASLSFE